MVAFVYFFLFSILKNLIRGRSFFNSMSNLKRLRKSKYKPHSRFLAGVIALIFLIQSLLPAAWSAQPLRANSNHLTATRLEQFQLPAALGTVEKIFIPGGTLLQNSAIPVIYIQDAHANPEVQRNIAKILTVLTQEKWIRHVGLEGAFGKVQPGLLNLFNDSKANLHMINHLASVGELTGAELFGLKHDLNIRGIDDAALYTESFKLFRAVKTDKRVEPLLQMLIRLQEQAENRWAHDNLRRYLMEKRQWEKSGDNAARYFELLHSLSLRYLKIDLSQAAQQFTQPNLVRLIKTSEIEKQFNLEKTRLETQALAEALKVKTKHSPRKDFLIQALAHFEKNPLGREFSLWLESVKEPRAVSVRHFFEMLYQESRESGVSLLNFPALMDAAGLCILHDEISAAGLMQELRPMQKRLEKTMAKTLEARQVLRLEQARLLIEKLLTLSLSSAEYTRLAAAGDRLNLDRLIRRYEGLLPDSKPVLPLPKQAMADALQFYRLSFARDKVLVKNTLAQTQKKSPGFESQAIVVIAGGFHQKGIRKNLEERGIPYVMITPKAGISADQHLYDKVMLGENASAMFQPLPAAAALNPRVMSDAYFPSVDFSGHRSRLMLDTILNVGIRELVHNGADASAAFSELDTALNRAQRAGFIQRFDLGRHGAKSDEWVLSVPELSWNGRLTWNVRSGVQIVREPEFQKPALKTQPAKHNLAAGLWPAIAGLSALTMAAGQRSEVRTEQPFQHIPMRDHVVTPHGTIDIETFFSSTESQANFKQASGTIEVTVILPESLAQAQGLREPRIHFETTGDMGRADKLHRSVTASVQQAGAEGVVQALRAIVDTLRDEPLAAAPRAALPETTQGRSEVRMIIDGDALRLLNLFPRDQYVDQIKEAVDQLDALKKAWIQKESAAGNPFMVPYAQSLSHERPARMIPVIEELMRQVAADEKLLDLPLPYRVAFVLAALDSENFPEEHAQLLKIFETVPFKNYADRDRLDVDDYTRLMAKSVSEPLAQQEKNILIRTVVERFVLALPRAEQQALEKEALIRQLQQEIRSTGYGNVPQVVFLTDLQDGSKAGDLIGYVLGLKNYHAIENAEALEARLKAERISLQDKNILFVSPWYPLEQEFVALSTWVSWLEHYGKTKFLEDSESYWGDGMINPKIRPLLLKQAGGSGAITTYFMRSPDGKPAGIRHFGYKDAVHEAASEIVEYTASSEMSDWEKFHLAPFLDGLDLAAYYRSRFLEENISSYQALIRQAGKRRQEDLKNYYKVKLRDAERKRKIILDTHLENFLKNFFDLEYQKLGDEQQKTIEDFYEWFNNGGFFKRWQSQSAQADAQGPAESNMAADALKKAVRENLTSPYRMVQKILESGVFVPGEEHDNQTNLKVMAQLLKQLKESRAAKPAGLEIQAIHDRALVVLEKLRRSEETQIAEMRRQKQDRARLDGRRDALYHFLIDSFEQMGTYGLHGLIEFISPGFDEGIRKRAQFALINSQSARSYFFRMAMQEANATERMRQAEVMDQTGKPGREELLFFLRHDVSQLERLYNLLGPHVPSFTALLGSLLFVETAHTGAREATKRIGERLGELERFKALFSPAAFAALLENWGLAAVSRWAQDPYAADKLNFFEILHMLDRADPSISPFVEAVILAEERQDPEFTRGVLQLLLETGNTHVLRGLVGLIVRDPAHSAHLVSFLIAQMKLMKVAYREDDFIQEEISRILHSDLSANYYLLRKLAAAIPHARYATGRGSSIREPVQKLDQLYASQNTLFRYLRVKMHSDPWTDDLALVQSVMEVLMGLQQPSERLRLKPEQVKHKLKTVHAQAREEVVQSILGEEAARLGQILNAVVPTEDSDKNPELFLIKEPLWDRAPHKETREFEAAKILIWLYQALEGRYGSGKGFYTEEERESLQDAAGLLTEAKDIFKLRFEMKQKLLAPAPFEPEMDIEHKRHNAERDWGFQMWGYYGTYHETKFDHFEADRHLENYETALLENFVDRRLPVLLRHLGRLLTSGVTAESAQRKNQAPEILQAAASRQTQEILEGLSLIIEQMQMDGIASRRLVQFLKELKQPGLDLLQSSNILSMMQEELRRFFSRLIFYYGDYPKEIARTAGRDRLRDRYLKDGDGKKFGEPEAARVQEALLADLYAEESGIGLLQKFVDSVQEFLVKLPIPLNSLYLNPPAEALPESRVLSDREFDPDTTSALETGAKGYELMELKNRGYPVPPFAILPSTLPHEMGTDLKNPVFRELAIKALLRLEKETGHVFPFDMDSLQNEVERRLIQSYRRENNIDPDSAQPLIISVRSGSMISMPGMMDSALNVPFNETIAEDLLSRGYPSEFVYDVYRRFLFSYGTVHLGIEQKKFSDIIDRIKAGMAGAKAIPLDKLTIADFEALDLRQVISQDLRMITQLESGFAKHTPFEQVLLLIGDVYQSWDSEGARNYRQRFGISSRFGTAVILQQMVYGNLEENSGTAVIDSSHPESGIREPFGNFKFGAQGTELVSGLTGTAQPFSRFQGPDSLQDTHPSLYQAMAQMARRVEDQEGQSQNLEMTVQDGELYLLQTRAQVMASGAVQKQLSPDPNAALQVIGRGSPVSGNAAVGRVLDARDLSLQALIEQVHALRRQMNAAGEESYDIILLYNYFTDDDSSKLLQLTGSLNGDFPESEGASLGILNSKIAQSNHASLISIRLGLAYVGKVDTLEFEPQGGILLGSQRIATGMAGPILSIDAYSPMKSATSGQVILGAVPFKFHVPTSKAKTATKRSEVRSASRAAEQQSLPEELSPQNVQIQTVGAGATGQHYVTSPKGSLDLADDQAVQHYLASVYNAIGDIAKQLSTANRTYHPHEIQVRDEVVAQFASTPNDRTALLGIMPASRRESGFVDQMDLFRLLSKMRGKTEIAAYPDLKKPAFVAPEKIALVVDAKVSDLEAAFIRDLVGNPDMALEVVIGTTPVQLAATLNHSIYRRFLRSGDVLYDQEQKWIEILGRRIRVIKNEEDISGEEWQRMGVPTFVATHPIRRRAEKLAAAVQATDNGSADNGITPPIRLIALEGLNPFTGSPQDEGTPAVSLNIRPDDAAVKMETPQILLRSALLDTPVRFLAGMQQVIGAATVAAGDYAVNYRISPMNASPLDESGRAKSPMLNEVPVSAAWTGYLRRQMRSAMDEAKLPGRALQSVNMSSIPAMLGDRADVTLNLRGTAMNRLLRGLKMTRPSLESAADFEEAEKLIREKLLEKMNQRFAGTAFFVANLQDAAALRETVNTDTRFERRVLVDRHSLQVNIIQGEKKSLQISISIPLVFNRDWQNSRHLMMGIREIAREESANAPVQAETTDLKLSPYGIAVQYARSHGTLPPASLEIPEGIDFLRPGPLQIGVVGYAGQIGARMHVPHDLNLNIAAGIGGKPQHIAHSFFDSTAGPLMSNGVPLPIIYGELEPHQEHQIGFVRIGDGEPVVLLKRYDDPRQIPWHQFGVEAVAETTGAFTDPTDSQSLFGHLELARGNQSGAEVVVLSAPFKVKNKEDKLEAAVFPTVVFGVNDTQVTEFIRRAEAEGLPKIFSNASCTTNCVATMAVFNQRLRNAVTDLMRSKYGLQHAHLGDAALAPVVSVHAPTNTQASGYRDFMAKPGVESRFRAADQATLTSSGVNEAIRGLRVEDLESFAAGATGYAVRGPFETSLAVVPVIFKVMGLEREDEAVRNTFNEKATVKEFQTDVVELYSQVGREMAADPHWRDVVAFAPAQDVITSSVAAGSARMIIDAQQVHVVRRGDLLMVTGNAWYDNVTNYAKNYLHIFSQIARVSQSARSEVRGLWEKFMGKKELSDDDLRVKIREQLNALKIPEGEGVNVDILLRRVKAVLEQWTDFRIEAEEVRTKVAKEMGTQGVLEGFSTTNSMLGMEGDGFSLADEPKVEWVETVKMLPKVVGAGTQRPARSEVRMLVLSRKLNEKIVIGDDLWITVTKIDAKESAKAENTVTLQIDGPGAVSWSALPRKKDEAIQLGVGITFHVVDIALGHVRLGIDAPREVTIHRKELYDAIRRDNALKAVQPLPGEQPDQRIFHSVGKQTLAQAVDAALILVPAVRSDVDHVSFNGKTWGDPDHWKNPHVQDGGTFILHLKPQSPAVLHPRLTALDEQIRAALSLIREGIEQKEKEPVIMPLVERKEFLERLDQAEALLHTIEEVPDLYGRLDQLKQDLSRFKEVSKAVQYIAGILPVVESWQLTLQAVIESRSEVRQTLARQGRVLQNVLAVAQLIASNTIDPLLAAAYPRFFRRSLGLSSRRQTFAERSDLAPLRQALQKTDRPLLTAGQAPETPKTLVLASLNSQVPFVDLEAMQLSAGSRVIILDSRGAEPVVWNYYAKIRLPKNVRIERGVFDGQRPDLNTLKMYFTEKGQEVSEEAARPLLIFPFVTEDILEDYSAIPSTDGLVVRAPRLAAKSATLRFAFSYFLGRGLLPAQLLKETPPDVFNIRIRTDGFSPAYVPLGAEGRFAHWASALAARELLEAAA